MGWLEFLSKVIDSLAWPAVALTSLALLRDPIGKLIPFLRELKYKEFSISFREKLEEARAAVEEEAAEGEAQGALAEEEPYSRVYAIDHAEHDRWSTIASLSPRAAILGLWQEIETFAKKQIESKGISTAGTGQNNSRIGHVLLHAHLINDSDFAVFHKLREIRNLAAHAPDEVINDAQAQDFVELSQSLHQKLRPY